MTADEFWKDDPQLFVSYRTSFINKKKREIEEFDYKCWYQGLYINDSFSKSLSKVNQTIYNGFQSFCKNPKYDNNVIENYPTKPYSELQKDKEKNNDTKTKKIKLNEQIIVQGSIKQIYLERLKQKNKK